MATPILKDRKSLIDETLRLGKRAFDPSLPEESQDRQLHLEKFRLLLAGAGGVQDTIEFILSVHPSTANLNGGRTGTGSCISHEALNAVSKLLSSPPSGVSAETWFNGIAPQLLSLLQGEGGLEMDKAAAFIIGFGVLGKKHYGSPGGPGWKAVVEPIFVNLSPSLCGMKVHTERQKELEGIETVGLRRIVSTPIKVAQSLQNLLTLLTSHPHPNLTTRLLRPILYPLWKLSYWPDGNDRTDKLYRKPAKKLLITLLELWPVAKEPAHSSLIAKLLDNLACGDQKISAQLGWKYVMLEDGSMQIEEVRSNDQSVDDSDLASIDTQVDTFIALLKDLPELTADISALFIRISSRWLMQNIEPPTVRIADDHIFELKNARAQFVEVKLLQKIMVIFPERLVNDSIQLLELITKVLTTYNEPKAYENQNEDVLEVALSLLNTVLTTPNFRLTARIKPHLELIEKDLEAIGRRSLSETSRTAGNLLMLLKLHDTISQPEPNLSAAEKLRIDQQKEDKKTYNLAISYLKMLESPPPVRVQGLELLSQLVRSGSSILDIPALITLLSSLLGDNEEYVHLRVIQLLVQLSRKHPKTAMKDITDCYVDSNEEYGLDERLRLGEALQQIIQANDSAFKLEIAKTVCQGLLFLGGRRGYRPRTERRQEKENLTKKRQDAEAEEAWGGPVPQIDELLHDDLGAREDLTQIVFGWESKRGSEDVRIRSSAMTILGTAIETNIEGISSQLLSTALDLSIQILTLEPEPEKGILRRAAVLLIMSLTKALDSARENGRTLKFGLVVQGLAELQRILKYIESTDNDGLVRQHARDVNEGLEAWQMNCLLPIKPKSSYLKSLAGLSISPGAPEGTSRRPRIEEVE